jgi:hypothetical protein
MWNSVGMWYRRVIGWILECNSSQQNAQVNFKFNVYVTNLAVWQPNMIDMIEC